MCHVSNPRLCYGTFIKSSEGAFKVAAPHVPFTLKITAEGYEEWWAPNGLGKNNSMTVPSGTQIELSCTLSRKPEFATRPMTEAEKQPLTKSSGTGRCCLRLIGWRLRILSAAHQTGMATRRGRGLLSGGGRRTATVATAKLRECARIPGRSRRPRSCRGCRSFAGTDLRIRLRGSSARPLARVGRRWSGDEEGFKSPWRVFFYLEVVACRQSCPPDDQTLPGCGFPHHANDLWRRRSTKKLKRTHRLSAVLSNNRRKPTILMSSR